LVKVKDRAGLDTGFIGWSILISMGPRVMTDTPPVHVGAVLISDVPGAPGTHSTRKERRIKTLSHLPKNVIPND